VSDQLLAILRSTLLSVAALMPIVNPIGSAPVFLAMSADLPPVGRRIGEERARPAGIARPRELDRQHQAVALQIGAGLQLGGRRQADAVTHIVRPVADENMQHFGRADPIQNVHANHALPADADVLGQRLTG